VVILIAVVTLTVCFPPNENTIANLADVGAMYITVLGMVITITMVCLAVEVYSKITRVNEALEKIKKLEKKIRSTEERIRTTQEQIQPLIQRTETLVTNVSSLVTDAEHLKVTMDTHSREAERLAQVMSATVFYSSWQYMKSNEIKSCLMDLQVNGRAGDADALQNWLTTYKKPNRIRSSRLRFDRKGRKGNAKGAITHPHRFGYSLYPDTSVISLAEGVIETLKIR